MAVDIQRLLDTLANIQRTTDDGRTKELLGPVLNDLQTFVKEQQAMIADLNAKLRDQEQAIATLQQQAGDLQKENENLKAQLANTSGVTSATPLGIASAFKSVIDAIQADARNSSGVGTTIKAMDIEVKSLLQVKDPQTTVMLFPSVGSTIDPNALSTLRVSFGAIPVASTPPRPDGGPVPPRNPPPVP